MANNHGGKSVAKKGLKRLKHKLYDGSSALNKPSVRRLARRGGVKRINAGVYDVIPNALRSFLTNIIKDAVTYAEHSRRLTIVINDVILALKRNGMTLYGYDTIERRRRLTRPLKHEHLAAAATRIALRRSSALQQQQQTTAPTSSHRTPNHTQTRATNTPNSLRAAPTSSAAALRLNNNNSSARNEKKGNSTTKEPSRFNNATLTTSTRFNRKSSITTTTAKPFASNNNKNNGNTNTNTSNTTKQSAQQKSTRTSSIQPPPTVSLERAFDIQSSLSAFRDAVIARQSSSDAPMQRVVDWVDAHLRGRGKPSCSVSEIEVVLEALNERDAIMLTGNGGSENDENSQRTVWFV